MGIPPSDAALIEIDTYLELLEMFGAGKEQEGRPAEQSDIDLFLG